MKNIKKYVPFLIVFIVCVITYGLVKNLNSNMTNIPRTTYISESTSPTGKYTIINYIIEDNFNPPIISCDLTDNTNKSMEPKNIYHVSNEDDAIVNWLSDSKVKINSKTITLEE